MGRTQIRLWALPCGFVLAAVPTVFLVAILKYRLTLKNSKDLIENWLISTPKR